MIIEDNLSYEEYVEIMKSTGWVIPAERLIKEGLKNSINVKYVVDTQSVGMARLITDKGYIALLADVIVKPEYQGLGIGKKLINSLLEKVRNNLQENEQVMIQLLAASGKQAFYEKIGFKDKKEAVDAGMYMWLKK